MTSLKEKWVKALRSGKYEQGVGKLQTYDGHFCCLGVLEDVVGTPFYPEEELTHDSRGHTILASGEQIEGKFVRIGEDGYLVGVSMDFNIQSSLTELNDRGTDFDEIAAFIEASLNDDLQPLDPGYFGLDDDEDI